MCLLSFNRGKENELKMIHVPQMKKYEMCISKPILPKYAKTNAQHYCTNSSCVLTSRWM